MSTTILSDDQALDLLNETFFHSLNRPGFSPVVFDMDFQGQKIDNKGRFVLGGRAGPSKHVSFLLHEMAHFCELELSRLLKKPYQWGFRWGKPWNICGRSGFEPQTDQSVLREIRTWAFQWSAHKALGIPLDSNEDLTLENLVSSATYLHAFDVYRYKRGLKATGTMSYADAEQAGLKLLEREVEQNSSDWFSYGRFLEEWNSRLSALGGFHP